MPLYRFKCQSCELQFQEFRGIVDRDSPITCTECNGDAKRMLDVASVSFIGKGFYSNDK